MICISISGDPKELAQLVSLLGSPSINTSQHAYAGAFPLDAVRGSAATLREVIGSSNGQSVVGKAYVAGLGKKLKPARGRKGKR